MEGNQFHETLTREHTAKASSDRSFGIVFAIVFCVIGFWPALDGGSVRVWSLILAAALAVVAGVRPRLLAVPNRLWLKFGALLHQIVSPVVMGLIFFAAVMPVGLIMRLLGKDPLGLGFDRGAKTYWVLRDPPGPDPKSMRNQF